ncbi:hypothetical protein N7468_009608 [Penicillium chermesinum]|uniref:Uncharacterized protein n=1 Tax=Penicillium chermesinum TaxID=63820 RepID=A0A9W9NKL1_9EURO|nr:uncharacterized protein N7468_009608 [Penicillium chermesinum]KAJ5220404.1 hypothetical protein N7468_009608 [Penicillium chermesinum]
MPLPGTPSPFRLPRRQSTRRAGPQFANSPRFLLSQSTPRTSNQIDIVDDDEPLSTAPAAYTPQRSVAPRRPRDVIEDSDDIEFSRHRDLGQGDTNAIEDNPISSTPPFEPDTPGPWMQIADEQGTRDQPLLSAREQASSSPDPRRQTHEALDFSAPNRLPRTTSTEPDVHATPRLSAKPSTPGFVTPGNTKTPFRSKPKFMLSSKKPLSSQPVYKLETPTATRQTSPPERRKPNFVLPKSPSPKKAIDDIPAPFSPSSRALHRRGRARAGVSAYAPGGMAAEVRSWILETGSKRENALPHRVSTIDTDNFATVISQYLVAARVLHARHGFLSSSGPLVFLEAEKVSVTSNDGDAEILRLMVMGPPRSTPYLVAAENPNYVQPGDLVGVHRGLAWDVDFQASGSRRPQDPEQSEGEKWLVAMDWDIIREPDS